MNFDHEFPALALHRSRKLLLAGTALVTMALIPSLAQAQSVWGGAGSTTTTSDYNLGTNWSTNPTSPVTAGSSAQFGATGSATVTVTAGPITPDSWTFTAASQNYTVSGQAVNFNGAGPNLINNGGTNSISNNMTGSGISVTAGQLTVSGTNSFTTTSVTGGTFANSGTLTSAVTNSATYNNTGTQNGGLTNSGTSTNSGTVNGGLANSGTYTQSGGATNGGTTNTGTVNANGGAFNGAIDNSTAGIFNIGGTVTSDNTFNNSTATSRLLVNSGTYTVTGLITNSGTNAGGGILVSVGATLSANGGLTNNAGATLINNGTLNGAVSNSGAFTTSGTLGGSLTQSAGTTTNSGTITGNASLSGGTLFAQGSGSVTGNVDLTNAAATFDISGAGAGASAGGLVGVNGSQTLLGTKTLTITNASSVNIFYGSISGSGGLTVTGGAQELGGTNTYTGVTTINNGAHLVMIGTGSIASSSKVVNNGSFDLSVTNADSSIKSLSGTNANATVFLGAGYNLTLTNAASDTYAGKIQGSGNLVVSSGVENLSGNNSYTGTTNVTAGALLSVSGSIASSSLTTVGGSLSGTGQVGALQINAGGVLAPGNIVVPGTSLTVASLALQSGASYAVWLNPATSTFTNVTGNANLGNGASVIATFANGSYVAKQYTIMTAGSITGAFNPTVTNSNLPSGFNTSLSYDPTHVYLNLALSFAPPSGNLNGNQQNVGNAIINYFNSNGSIPIAFGGLTPAGLTQLSGEVGSAPQQATFNAMTQFLSLMTDPFVAGRSDPISAGGTPNAFADESLSYAASGKRPASAREAFAAYTKAPVAPSFEQLWSVWAAGFGGSQQTDGNAVVGSNNTTSNLYGMAVGADYRLSRDTLIGFALAGGGTNFSVAGNLGGGRSDLFQAGAFVRHNMGSAYLSGALAYGWQDITTNRTLTIAGVDQLRAQFNANAWSGRIEGGYRFVSQGFGWTPYAAGQFTTFDLPAYAEQAIVGTNTFALAYGARSVTATRSEFGLRTDKSFAADDGVFTLRGRLAWAHDYNPDRAIGATFQTLPGASFVVNGAKQASDSALVTASVEKKWLTAWSAAATFEGEFSNVTASYAGKGVVRYAW